MKSRKGICVISILLIMCVFLSGCDDKNINNVVNSTNTPTLEDFNNEIVVSAKPTETPKPIQEENDDFKDSEIEQQNSVEVSGNIEVKFIDVGQGDSCLIVTPNKEAVLIDTGDSTDAKEILDVLHDYEIDNIDLMVLSHPHKDHIGGANTILNEYTVLEVLLPSYVSNTKTFNKILDTLDSQNVTVTQAVSGKQYDIDNMQIKVLDADISDSDCNNSSAVLKITYGDISMLFMGDLEADAEKVLLDRGYDLNADILKVGHHGSDTSTSEEFLVSVDPRVAIISCGKDNKYGHPSSKTLEKLDNNSVQYYRTDEVGTITLEIDGENIVTSFSDSFETVNNKSGKFLYSPNIAEVGLDLQAIVEVETNQ